MSLTRMISRSVALDSVPPYGFDVPPHIAAAFDGLDINNTDGSIHAMVAGLNPSVYTPPRGDDFREYLREVFILYGKATREEAVKMTSDNALIVFDEGMTSKHANMKHNYEVYEKLGDLRVNLLITELIVERYPNLQCANTQSTIDYLSGRLRNKASLSKWAGSMGMLPWIASTYTDRIVDRHTLLEDVFESFIYCVATIAKDCLGYREHVEMVRNIVSHFVYSGLPLSMRDIDAKPPGSLVKENYSDIGMGAYSARISWSGVLATAHAGVTPKGGTWTLMGTASDRDPGLATRKAWTLVIHHLVDKRIIPDGNIAKLFFDPLSVPCDKLHYFAIKDSKEGVC